MSFSKSHKLLLGLGAISGVATIYFTNSQKNKADASWTTNYTPSPFSKWDENWDHRSPRHMHTLRGSKSVLTESDQNKINAEKEWVKPTVCRHIILIRHGQYNLDGTTDEQRVLTQLGRDQAGYTGRRLKDMAYPYTAMVKSTMARAQETGTIISKSLPNVPVTNCDLLREGAPVPPEPPLGRYKPELFFYQDGSRIEAGFRKYFYRAGPEQEKDSYTLLVCHANVIRYFICRALQFPAEGWLRFSLNHASITWITITPSGRCVLRAMGDSGHMPPNVITST